MGRGEDEEGRMEEKANMQVRTSIVDRLSLVAGKDLDSWKSFDLVSGCQVLVLVTVHSSNTNHTL